ncbi:MAG TPA: sigma-54 dependent transcriptional regulator, partial [Planctomycetota bacterium]|nr:sigma-54 dependent transcriptional regulator [Planctomycetota bacterium]
AADLLYAYSFAYRWGTRADTNDAHYDPVVDAATAVLRDETDLDAILSDLKLPDGDALELLRRAADHRPNVPTVVFSGVGTVAHAVEAMKAGALDFLSKPVDPGALLAVVRRAVEHHGLVEEVRRLKAAVPPEVMQARIIGSSRALQDVLALARRAAATDARVLLQGESGTGKELLALEIHRASRRARRPFVRVNCGAIPESLFESEMFGHKRGAFTGASEERLGVFAEAHGGTIALDEVGALPLEAQAKLLRVLETGEYARVGESRPRHADARVIAITNEDLAERVRAGSFREDLYFRLNVVPIVVPPLRDRKEDLPELSAHLLERIARRDGGPARRLAPSAAEVLARHDWPGNVRELRNVLERATIVGPGGPIAAETLDGILAAGFLRSDDAEGADAIRLGDDLHLRSRTEAFQREVIREALARSGGVRKECARLLGVDARNLAYYIRKHGLAEPP